MCGLEKYLDSKIPEENLDCPVKCYWWQQNKLGYAAKKEIVTNLSCAKEKFVLN